MKFEELDFGPRLVQNLAGIQATGYFPNGYGYSIIQGFGTYTSGPDEYELAVLYNDKLCYTTPITSDVLGHLSREQVEETLAQIEALEPRT